MSRKFDVVIVGGGVVGSSAAYFLASQPAFGGTVAVVERDPTYAEAATPRSAGGIFGPRDEGWLDPYSLLQAFRRKARSLGVTYIQDEVAGLNLVQSRVTS